MEQLVTSQDAPGAASSDGANTGADAPSTATTPEMTTPSVVATLLRRLLLVGLAGGHVALVVMAVVFGLARGASAGASAAIGAVVTIMFFTLGQAVVLRFAERDAYSLLVAGMVSYGVRVAGLGAALAAYNAAGLEVLDPLATALGIIVTVLAWTTSEVVAVARMRIPVYDRDVNVVSTRSRG